MHCNLYKKKIAQQTLHRVDEFKIMMQRREDFKLKVWQPFRGSPFNSELLLENQKLKLELKSYKTQKEKKIIK